MKASLVVSAIVVAVLCFVCGFWIGFRQAWMLAPMAESAPRGVSALYALRSLESGQPKFATDQFQSDIDAGLLFWHEISHSNLFPVMNALSGTTVNPSYEEYIRPLATYRRSNPSPFWDSPLSAEMEANLADADPHLAQMMKDSELAAQKHMQAVIDKYAQ